MDVNDTVCTKTQLTEIVRYTLTSNNARDLTGDTTISGQVSILLLFCLIYFLLINILKYVMINQCFTQEYIIGPSRLTCSKELLGLDD